MRIASSSLVATVNRVAVRMRTEEAAVTLRRAPATSAVALPTPTYEHLGRSRCATPASAQDEEVLRILRDLFGMKTMRVADPLDARTAAAASLQIQAPGTAQPAAGLGWSMVAEGRTLDVSVDVLAFAVRGEIDFADGSRAAVDLQYRQELIQVREESWRLTAGDPALSDPLVIDLAGSGLRFAAGGPTFADSGTAMILPDPGAAAGYVVWDLDGDGRLSDGRELLGWHSGEAYADLAALDDDGNGWIDANDQAFHALLLVGPDGRGLTLPTVGVAALATSGTAAAMDHRDAAGTLLARTRSLGLWAGASGQVGVVQQVDVAA